MRKPNGFTLIELLIVVTIIGIIAAIAIPNLLNALNRGRQKKTMADLRALGTAQAAYQVDFGFYPRYSYEGPFTGQSLREFLTPTYIQTLPLDDGWGRSFIHMCEATGSSYTLYSQGRDGTGTIPGAPGPTTDFNAAIVFSNGQFYAWPEGMQIN